MFFQCCAEKKAGLPPGPPPPARPLVASTLTTEDERIIERVMERPLLAEKERVIDAAVEASDPASRPDGKALPTSEHIESFGFDEVGHSDDESVRVDSL